MINFLHKYRLDHIAFGWLIILPVWLLTGSPLMAWIAQSFYWLGREIRDHEVKAKIKLPQHWYRGWYFVNWSKDGHLDLWLSTLVNGAILGVIYGYT